MLTVQEIQAMSFEKAVFGGYDMKTVDEFIEQITEDYSAQQKENAALKSKMKVLVDKIEEYKSVEDGMRRALVSAQNIAQETIEKSKLEAEELLNTAKVDAETQIKEYQSKIEQESAELSRIRQETAEFISKMTGYFEKQTRSLVEVSTSELLADEKLSVLDTELPVDELQTVSEEQISVEDPTMPQESNYTIPEDIRQFMQQMDPGSNNEGMKIKVMEVTLNDSSAGEAVSDDTKHFGNLKFGADYAKEQDR